MNEKTKLNVIMLMASVFILFFFIASGLTDLKLNPGMPLPEIKSGKDTVTIESRNIGQTVPMNDLIKKVFVIILAVSIAMTVIWMIIKIRFKNIIGTVVNVLLITVGVTGIFLLIIFFFPPSENAGVSQIIIKPPKDMFKSALGTAPFILLVFSGLIVLMGVILLLYKIFFHTEKPESSQIELEALRARDAILSGADLKSAITECYIRMCESLKRENEIEREQSMTPEEFEKRLEEAGAPAIYIRELTALFEAVRYGNMEPEEDDEQKAVRCFDAIIAHFRNESKKADHGKK
jgi:hypothetical protein